MALFTKPSAGARNGFTLIELMVSLAVFSIFMIGILNLLDSSTKLTKLETQLADTQENVRFATYHVMRMARMMGGAGIPFAGNTGGSDAWLAGRVASNQNGSFTTRYTLGAVEVLDGSDVLSVSGFFETAPFFIKASDVNSSLNQIVVNESVEGRVINPGMNAVEANLLAGRGLVLMGKIDQTEYAVGQVGVGSTMTGTAPNRTLTISINDGPAAWWTALNPSGTTMPPTFDVYQVGIIDAYTYFVDPEFRLMRLRADGSSDGASEQPVAVNIGGFQVALGVDTSGDGLVNAWEAAPTAAGISGNRVISLRVTVLGRTPMEVPGWAEPASTFLVEDATIQDSNRGHKWRRLEVATTLRNYRF